MQEIQLDIKYKNSCSQRNDKNKLQSEWEQFRERYLAKMITKIRFIIRSHTVNRIPV